MAIVDKQLQMSDQQDLSSASTGIQYSTNVIFLPGDTTEQMDPGQGRPAYWVVKINSTAFAGGTTTTTLSAALYSDSSTAPTTEVAASAAQALDTLTKGKEMVRVPIPLNTIKQYVRAGYTPSAALGVSNGLISSWIEL